MSCRVIGRTVEEALLGRLCREAAARGCTRLRGRYVPTAKNGLVEDLYERLGFEAAGTDGPATIWTYDIEQHGAIATDCVAEEADDRLAP
jgi:predicted enzyme involved in methoxymalonyl-ACP biosynthesis